MKKFLFIIFLILTVYASLAQEIIINNGNPVLQSYSKNYFKKNIMNKLVTDTLELPFVDDFSNSYIYPDSTKWIDKYVFINNNYGINNISYNVATFDAINENGDIYNGLSSSSSKIADHLSSLPINLNYEPADSIYLSFYYQCAGTGDMPEQNDSLVLQFYSMDNKWVSVWRRAGGIVMDTFKLVMLPIKNPSFLYKGFKFRFLNYVSISSNYEPSWKSNCDVWNIDYITLNKNRNINDTLTNDIAFIKNFKSLLKNYESVPCKHYAAFQNKSGLINDSVLFMVKNNCIDTNNITREFYLYDTYSSTLLFDYSNDYANILPTSTLKYNKNVANIEFPITEDLDSAKFTLFGNISARDTADPIYTRWNDTIRYYQYFENYYAYDDGTAEAGYGVSGTQAKVAYKFDILTCDTLKGVLMYFNKVVEEANVKYFYLSLWRDDNGYPGELIHEIEGVKPIYSNLNQYLYYKLDTAIFIDTTFYVGWRKTTNDVLNVGFDYDRDASDKLFFNTDGYWEKTQYKGALMLRPVFGKEPKNVNINVFEKNISNCNIYPNPANEFFSIDMETDGLLNIEIYDISGKLLLTSNTNKNINILSLNSGIYFVKIASRLKNYNTQKLIIHK